MKIEKKGRISGTDACTKIGTNSLNLIQNQNQSIYCYMISIFSSITHFLIRCLLIFESVKMILPLLSI